MTGRLPADGAPAPALATRDADPAAWDAFVEANARGSYLQLGGWARVKAVNGWSARRLHDPGTETAPAAGAQVLLRRPGALPWAFAYAPRGPVLDRWDPESIARFTALAQAGLRTGGRVSHLRIDPEIERDAGPDEGGAVVAGLLRAGWRAAPPIQPSST
ncbi:MAG: aminoacyltransferase, partial [Chloroflexi bacterium]|nr:aminoacyltransferase [Chloroflexota bacterium]